MLAIVPGAAAFGLVYGFLAGQKGMTLPETALTSMLVFAGASQLLALELWGDPLPYLSLVAGVLVINLRHALMGPTLVPWLRPLSPARSYGSLFFMVDESWGMSVAEMRAGGRDAAFLLGAGAMLWVVWTSSSVLGRLAGDVSSLIENWGLAYLTTAFFVALLAGFWRGRHDLLPWAVAAGVAVSTKALLPGTWYIVLGALAGSLIGAWSAVRGRG
jgi:predicted branched-subunit amino acid permease